MLTVREAAAEDGPALVAFFRDTPLEAGTAFVLDRSPDFTALLRLRGSHRVFVAADRGRLAGTATALWHDARDGHATLRVGEIVDLRVAPWARGGRAALVLLQAVRQTFDQVRTEWVVCLVGAANRAATPLTEGGAGLPALRPLARYASVHYVAVRLSTTTPPGVVVRPATVEDGVFLARLADLTASPCRLVPSRRFTWPDPSGQHRAWIAEAPDGAALGGLVLWDGAGIRRIRVVRYAGWDLLLRFAVAAGSRLGLARPLPPPGGALRLWASRWFGVIGAREVVARALVRTAIAEGLREDQHVVQLNLAGDDPLLGALPRGLRSTYWSTLYGAPWTREWAPSDQQVGYHADVALV
jgi:hypothetical protein